MTAPALRLRVQRLVIVETRVPTTKFVEGRDLQVQPGLNIVWAQELPTEEGATEKDRAGHGVGKSTFCLMLRAVLGDAGVAVTTMCSHLAEHYGSGGIAAEVLAGDTSYAVFRAYGSGSFAIAGGKVEQLFDGEERPKLEFDAYVHGLAERACLSHLQSRSVSAAKPPVEWRHLLPWISRDQGLGLRRYFEWRNGDDGKDGPGLVRLALGLLTDSEAKADSAIASANSELKTARKQLRAEEQRGSNVRNIIETSLRTWAGVSNSLQMVSDDLFAESVETEIRRRSQAIEGKTEKANRELASLEDETISLEVEIRQRTPIVERAKSLWEESVALRDGDGEALAAIRKRRDDLKVLEGQCGPGNVSFRECSYVKAETDLISLRAKRDVGNMQSRVDELAQQAEQFERAFKSQEAELKVLTDAKETKNNRKKTLRNENDARAKELGKRDGIRENLAAWAEERLAPETEKLRAARASVEDVQGQLESAKRQKFLAQQEVSEREQRISRRMGDLAKAFGGHGRYLATEEERPFQMLAVDGDAYRPLEILLGDLACAQDGAEGAGAAHPGLLVFDCPQERAMGQQIYGRFLTLVDEVCRATPGLQVFITTTTPPPAVLTEKPSRVVLQLSRKDLLLKRRIENLLARAVPSSRDEEEDAS
jgi:hypothetical protein